MTKPTATSFGRRLREARLEAGLPQDRLGVMIGIDEGSASTRISRYETGIHEPAYDTAENLAKVFGIPTAYFYCDDDKLAQVIFRWPRLSTAEKNRILKSLE
jgi:transcriptional regulator with XRE-family HTH domain